MVADAQCLRKCPEQRLTTPMCSGLITCKGGTTAVDFSSLSIQACNNLMEPLLHNVHNYMCEFIWVGPELGAGTETHQSGL